jgi:REP element-mobilizing transposase RayT
MQPNQHRRRSIRLPGYGYAQPGAYFVTTNAYECELLFGNVVNGEMERNARGEIVVECWQAIPDHFAHTALDAFVVMPNHIHGIVMIVDPVRSPGVGATHASPLPRGPAPGSIGAIVGSFKSAVTKRINQHRATPGATVWQRNYYEHVIRATDDLDRIREYIVTNPARWTEDRYYRGSVPEPGRPDQTMR